MDGWPEAATRRDLLTKKVSGAASPKVGARAEQLGVVCPEPIRGSCPRVYCSVSRWQALIWVARHSFSFSRVILLVRPAANQQNDPTQLGGWDSYSRRRAAKRAAASSTPASLAAVASAAVRVRSGPRKRRANVSDLLSSSTPEPR